MPGRPRAQVQREPNGRASRRLRKLVDAELRPAEFMAPAELRRFLAQAAADTRFQHFGFPVGRLMLAGRIDASQYVAARLWDCLADEYQRVIGSPPACRPEPLERRSRAEPSERQAMERLIQERFAAACAALEACGRDALKSVREICEGMGRHPAGHAELMSLRRGLSMLVAHWRVAA